MTKPITIILILIPFFIFFGLIKYFYGYFDFFTGLDKHPDLEILRDKRVEGVLPVYFNKNERFFRYKNGYGQEVNAEFFYGQNVYTYPNLDYPTYIAIQVSKNHKELKYSPILAEDISFVQEKYFAHNTYLQKMMKKGDYGTSNRASGSLWVFSDQSDHKIYGLELDSETMNDFGTHETLLLNGSKIFYSHYRNIPRDADGTPLLILFILLVTLIIEGMYINSLNTKHNQNKKKSFRFYWR